MTLAPRQTAVVSAWTYAASCVHPAPCSQPPVYGFIRSHIRGLHVFLDATCHVQVCHNGRDVLRATALTSLLMFRPRLRQKLFLVFTVHGTAHSHLISETLQRVCLFLGQQIPYFLSLARAIISIIFVAINVLSQQTRVCRNKHVFVATKKSFVATKVCL